jgi:hypothetical protein
MNRHIIHQHHHVESKFVLAISLHPMIQVRPSTLDDVDNSSSSNNNKAKLGHHHHNRVKYHSLSLKSISLSLSLLLSANNISHVALFV